MSKTYDCFTCGRLDQEYHDGREGTPCYDHCIPEGQCSQAVTEPAVKKEDGSCYWSRSNGHMDEWYLPDPEHRERTAEDGPAPYYPLKGQIGFDGQIVGAET